MVPYSADKKNVFTIGIICLVCSLGLILFALYILPYLILNLGYNVPEFVMDYVALLQEKYSYSSGGSKLIVWLTFLIPGLITGYMSHYISHYLDKDK